MATGSARRRFLVFGHTQVADTAFSLNDLAGAAGRLDVLCRAVTSALCLSHGLRGDTEVWTVVDHDAAEQPRTVVWHGDRLRHLNPDERSTAALFKKAFAHDAIDHLEEVHPGLEVAEWSQQDALRVFAEGGDILLLDKDGDDLRSVPPERLPPHDPTVGFVLSDHRPWTDEEMRLLDGLAEGRVSVGPRWLHGHHAITLVHDELDRRTA